MCPRVVGAHGAVNLYRAAGLSADRSLGDDGHADTVGCLYLHGSIGEVLHRAAVLGTDAQCALIGMAGALRVGDAGAGAGRVAEYHQHLVGRLGGEVIACGNGSQDDDPEGVVAFPFHPSAVVIEGNGEAAGVIALNVGQTGREGIVEAAQRVEREHLLVALDDGAVGEAHHGTGGILVLNLHVFSGQGHDVDLSRCLVAVLIALIDMQLVSVVAHLLIDGIAELVVHGVAADGIEGHVGLLAVKALHLDALAHGSLPVQGMHFPRRCFCRSLLRSGFLRRGQVDGGLALVLQLRRGYILELVIATGQRVGQYARRVGGINLRQIGEGEARVRGDGNTLHGVLQRQQLDGPLTRFGVGLDGHLVGSLHHVGLAVHVDRRGGEVAL